jgi:hypothetical protein
VTLAQDLRRAADDGTTMPARQETTLATDRVRCLACETTYSKPVGGGTLVANPGCPKCGYVGWIAHSVPVQRLSAARSAAVV